MRNCTQIQIAQNASVNQAEKMQTLMEITCHSSHHGQQELVNQASLPSNHESEASMPQKMKLHTDFVHIRYAALLGLGVAAIFFVFSSGLTFEGSSERDLC